MYTYIHITQSQAIVAQFTDHTMSMSIYSYTFKSLILESVILESVKIESVRVDRHPHFIVLISTKFGKKSNILHLLGALGHPSNRPQ